MVDFKERLRKKLDELKNPKLKQRRTWSPPKDGSPANIRLLAYPYSSDPDAEPFVELWFHYGVGGNFGILCPKHNVGSNPCAICDNVSDLFNSKDEDNINMAKRIRAQMRAYAVMVDRADPTLTPKFWGFSKTNYIKLVEYLQDDDYEKPLDPVRGNDVIVSTVKVEGKSYPNTEVKMRPRTSPLGSSGEIEKVLANIPRIEEVFKPLSNAEIAQKLQEFVGGISPEEVQNSGAESVRGSGSSSASKVVEAAADNVDRAFDEALAD